MPGTPCSNLAWDPLRFLADHGPPTIRPSPQAEAQCAWLDSKGLVDGVITDDNDAFLFGSTHVYRHIFDNKRCACVYGGGMSEMWG